MTLVRVQSQVTIDDILPITEKTTLVEQKSKQTEPEPMSSPINNPALWYILRNGQRSL